jgi:putative DNA primase/helicase
VIDATFGLRRNGLKLDITTPLHSATVFAASRYRINQILTLRHTGGLFYDYDAARGYQPCEDATLRASVYAFLSHCTTEKGGPFKATASRVSDILDALKAITHVPSGRLPPCWLDSLETQRDPFEFLQCANGLIYLPTRELEPSTPRLFATAGVDFDYSPTLPPPAEWLAFLEVLFPGDQESQDTLQEWIGYLLTSRTHFQKIFMLVGPKRSGKGTIGRVIRRLLGDARVAGPTLANLGEQFGLAVLLHKSAAIIADARISGRSDMAIIAERLLSISGEDTLSVPRKFKDDWTGKLPTRFMLMTNELPKIEDSSGALASRFLVLVLRESFYGREDHDLFEKFVPELPAILNWALDGWDRLRARGRFLQPTSAADLIQQFEDLGSPVNAFITEQCTLHAGFTITQKALFAAWQTWCKETGREHAGTIQTFGKQLSAAVPWLKHSRPRIAGDRERIWEGIQFGNETTQETIF